MARKKYFIDGGRQRRHKLLSKQARYRPHVRLTPFSACWLVPTRQLISPETWCHEKKREHPLASPKCAQTQKSLHPLLTLLEHLAPKLFTCFVLGGLSSPHRLRTPCLIIDASPPWSLFHSTAAILAS